ncbi:hypothetical protein [Neobacillus sp. PS3-40]|uniref:hypothetical protein n=1 Tax=Neobacillus sp. PS3-40 TaxID=3070679 RepID=UPI0027E04921|nr:hypothetical protein [Neobacillus sp. PS3-40]WML45409.1 hypothetical protein RCG20_05770 [Neobacillus sp. PS3-40]
MYGELPIRNIALLKEGGASTQSCNKTPSWKYKEIKFSSLLLSLISLVKFFIRSYVKILFTIMNIIGEMGKDTIISNINSCRYIIFFNAKFQIQVTGVETMKVTLECILKNNKNIDNMKKLKKILYQGKQTGIIFYQESVFKLDLNMPFSLYYFQQPGMESTVNAFPISVGDFTIFKKKEDQLHFLMKYFEVYYRCNLSDENFLLKYELNNPFIGYRYLWFYKKSEINGFGKVSS